jgi:AcrR family transcriptional regulator
MTARREQILAAARTCFLRKGLHNTSMQDLIREADLSVGAVYRYFKSKTEIINAISESVAGDLSAHLHDVGERDLPLAESISLVLDVIDEQLGSDGNFRLALQVWAEASIDPAIGEIVRHRFATMRSTFSVLVANAIRRGELPADADIDDIASVLFGMMPGYAVQRLFVGTPDKDAYLRGLRALLQPRDLGLVVAHKADIS